MASYPQIIQLPTQQPFNMMQNPIINAYASALMKKKVEDISDSSKEKKQQAKLDKFAAWAKQNNKDLEYSMSPSGMSAKTVTEKEPTMNDMQMAYFGAASPKMAEKLAKRMNVDQQVLPPEETPGAAMSMIDGGMGDIMGNPVAPVQENYAQSVQRALKGNANFPYNQRAKQAEAKDATAQSKILPTEFKSDLTKAMQDSNGDEKLLLLGLEDLRTKYVDNPTAFSNLSKIIDDHKKSSKKSDSSMSRLRSGG